jgi:hypothetical protein
MTRTDDADGRLHVSATPIRKANISSYLGREIPGHKRLRLQPGKLYRLWRDPKELT